MRHLFSFFLLFYLLPSAYWDCWIGCCGSTCPRLLSGTNFKKPAWKKKRWKGKYGGERARGEEERGSSSTTEPLQLFKWPLSLCTCSLCLVWILKWPPPKRQISRRWSPRREQRLSVLDFLHPHHSSWWTGDYLCDWLHDFEEEGIPVTFGLNSMKDRLRDCVVSIKRACYLHPSRQERPTSLTSAHWRNGRGPDPFLAGTGWSPQSDETWSFELKWSLTFTI